LIINLIINQLVEHIMISY